jgi:cold shock CspA family protein
MQVPLQVVFKNLEHSDAVEAAIREQSGRLERFAGDLISCKVTVAAPHRHHHKGNTYHVSVDLHVPGAEIVVNRDPGRNHAHEDVYVAIRDAMNAAARRLEDHARIGRGKVKRHEPPAHGRVAELHPDEDYGRIASPDGRSIYFHRNSLLDSRLEDLAIGSEVRFDEEAGDRGPQASSVRLIGKHHISG